jgi:phosphoglycerate dehydrogenase-like enzyme
MIAAPELDLMKEGAGLVNYSRAGVIDYAALGKKLVKGELVAILDVFDAEPLPKSSVLWKTPNLLITPHSSSDDWELYTPKTLDLMFENMRRFLAGGKLKNVVDPKLQY